VLYEYACSGGLLSTESTDNLATIAQEGWAMLRAVAADLVALPDTQVNVLADHHGLPAQLPDCELTPVHNPADEQSKLRQLAKGADWTLLIAPEFDHLLYERCTWVESAGGRLLGPGSRIVELLSDKTATICALSRHGVPIPAGMLWSPGHPCPTVLVYPVIVKANDGAGSLETYFCGDSNQLADVLSKYRRAARVETMVEGLAASVAVLCGPAGYFPLPACSQRLNMSNGRVAYLGGSLPLEAPLQARAQTLALRAVSCLARASGYIGVDMVLGQSADGTNDTVIEMNPRLTTSYIGLRGLARSNLAGAMLAVAQGQQPVLSFAVEGVEFMADGTVIRRPLAGYAHFLNSTGCIS
jgi:predicted ATP-grasp superfamily ATP-dependent carboligase